MEVETGLAGLCHLPLSTKARQGDEKSRPLGAERLIEFAGNRPAIHVWKADITDHYIWSELTGLLQACLPLCRSFDLMTERSRFHLIGVLVYVNALLVLRVLKARNVVRRSRTRTFRVAVDVRLPED